MLNTAALKTAIVNALTANVPNPTETQVNEINTLATALSSAIEAFVKTAQVVYSAGLVAPSGGGPVTGTITHTIQ